MKISALLENPNEIWEIKRDPCADYSKIKETKDLYLPGTQKFLEKFGDIKLHFVDYWKHGFNYSGIAELPEGNFDINAMFYAQNIYRIPMAAVTTINQNLYLQGDDELEISVNISRIAPVTN